MTKKLYCKSCEKHVYDVTNLEEGMQVNAGMFHGVNGYPDPCDGDIFKCPVCGEEWKPSLESVRVERSYDNAEL